MYLFVNETVEVQLLYELPVLRQQEPRSDLYNKNTKKKKGRAEKKGG